MPRSRAAQGFVRLLQAEQQLSEVALFGELYCAAFQVRWVCCRFVRSRVTCVTKS